MCGSTLGTKGVLKKVVVKLLHISRALQAETLI